MKTRWQIIGDDPWWVFRTALVACVCWLGLAGLVSWGAVSYVDARSPVKPILLRGDDDRPFDLVPREGGGYWFYPHLRVDPSEGCTKISQHLLFLPRPGKRPIFYTLATGLAGENLQSHSESQPGVGAHDFDAGLEIPRGMSGDLFYQYREEYRCWPLGLISYSDSTVPVLLRIP